MGAVEFKVDTEIGQTVAAFQKVVDAQNKLIDGFRKSGRAAKDHNSVMDTASSKLLSYIGPAAAAATAIGIMKSAFSGLNEEASTASDNIQKQTDSLKTLAQAAATPAEMKQLKAQALEVSKDTGMDKGQAQELVAQAKFVGKEKESTFFGRLSSFTDPTAMLKATDQLQTAFGGDKSGNSEQVVNQIIAAANVANVKSDALAAASVSAAQMTKSLGGGSEELLANTAIIGRALKSPEEAATQINAFASLASQTAQKNKDKLSGGIEGAYKYFSSMDEDTRNEVMGSNIEAQKFFGAYSTNREQILQTTQEAQNAKGRAGTTASDVTNKIAVAESDPMLQAKKRLNKATIDQEIANEPQGFRKMANETAIKEADASAADRGMYRGNRWIARTVANAVDYFGGTVPGAQSLAPQTTDNSSQQFVDALRENTQATKNLQASQENRRGSLSSLNPNAQNE